MLRRFITFCQNLFKGARRPAQVLPIAPPAALSLEIERPRVPHQIGPGKRSMLVEHRRIAKGSRYMPHQGARERARRRCTTMLEAYASVLLSEAKNIEVSRETRSAS